MCILTITHKPNQQRFVIPSYDIFPILPFTSILTCPVVTSSTRRVWPIHRGCLHLLGIWSHLYIFRGPCLLCFEFVFRYTGFWDCRQIVIFIFHWLNFNNKRWATITTDNILSEVIHVNKLIAYFRTICNGFTYISAYLFLYSVSLDTLNQTAWFLVVILAIV